ncbi:NeuD/PglB/VioB family sugar acetyltransferase [Sphaerochaeta sp.]|uniref:NeuD/PglB/VioB family sugar acetyltransferase n=1 Tax=Sphaerochaeta sp. TaxID=1972642 RepID=UPI003D0E04CC
MKPDIILVGGGGHCKSVIDVIEQEDRFRISGIIDMTENVGRNVLGYPVIGCDDDLEVVRGKCSFAVITVGQLKNCEIRLSLFKRLNSLQYNLPVIISPRAYVSKHAAVGAGTVIMHDSLVNANAMIGLNCIINSKALIEHDAVIEDHCHISTGAVVNGGGRVGEGSFYGSNATCRQSADIPSGSFVKAGSVFK